jgi:hypothetical protein
MDAPILAAVTAQLQYAEIWLVRPTGWPIGGKARKQQGKRENPDNRSREKTENL